jgi:hypothetical protein
MSNDFEIDRELIDGFLSDSNEIMKSLKLSLSHFTSTGDPKYFEAFGQGIDRIMGAAYTLGFKTLGDLSKLGKDLGYKGSQLKVIDQHLTVQSLLSQLVKETEKNLKYIKKGDFEQKEESQLLIKKLNQASASLGDLRTSVQF